MPKLLLLWKMFGKSACMQSVHKSHLVILSTLYVRSSYLLSCTWSTVSPAVCNCLVTCQQLQKVKFLTLQVELHQLGAIMLWYYSQNSSWKLEPLELVSKKVENLQTGHGQSQSAPLSASRRKHPNFSLQVRYLGRNVSQIVSLQMSFSRFWNPDNCVSSLGQF